MQTVPHDIQIRFFRFYEDELSIAEFEQWIYRSERLEHILNRRAYIDLLALSYKSKQVKHEVRKIMDPILGVAAYEEYRVRNVLNDLIEPNEQFIDSLIMTYELGVVA